MDEESLRAVTVGELRPYAVPVVLAVGYRLRIREPKARLA